MGRSWPWVRHVRAAPICVAPYFRTGLLRGRRRSECRVFQANAFEQVRPGSGAGTVNGAHDMGRWLHATPCWPRSQKTSCRLPGPEPGCGRSLPATVPRKFLADRQFRPLLGNEKPPCGVERNWRPAERCEDDEAGPHRGDVDAEPSGDGRCHPAEHAAIGWAAQHSLLLRVGAFGGLVCRLLS